jgi:hypothetical protein
MQALASDLLVEEMAGGGVAEVLVGVTCDATGTFLLTLGAGGVLTEILGDTVSLLLPVTSEDIIAALQSLKIGPLLRGYRGKPAADVAAVANAVQSVCRYVEANSERLLELEINPLIAREHDAVAVDALISQREN